MSLIFESLITDLILVLSTLCMVTYAYFMYCYTYWERKNVVFLPPKFPYGNSNSLKGGVHFTLDTRNYYNAIKNKGLRYGGIYILNRPVLVLRDPEYIKDILTKDYEYFLNRAIYHNEQDDPISAHLFAIGGKRWKNLRAKITPIFTSIKMKMMFPIMVNLSSNLNIALDKAAEEGIDIDIFEYSAKFTTDIICNIVFGIDSNTFEDPNSEFRQMSNKTFEIKNILGYINNFIIGFAPSVAAKLHLVGTRKDVSNYFHDLCAETRKYRIENNIRRSDFFQLLNELMDSTAKLDNQFTWEELVAQCFLFFVAGFDTTSTTLLFTFYELSRNQDIQDKVRDEIEAVLEKHNGEITYEALGELKYMQQVIDESQRLYPPVTTIDRVCTKDYKLRNSNGFIGKGVTALISIYGLHRDPEYYPNPEKFDPERFSPENKKLRHPYLHLPFGGGPRQCIGLRFGLMEAKIGLTMILRRYRLTVSSKTEPVISFKDSFFLRPENTVYLKAEKL